MFHRADGARAEYAGETCSPQSGALWGDGRTP